MSKKLLAAGMLPWAAFAHAESTTSSVDDTMVVTASRFEQSTQSLTAQVEIVTRQDIDRMQAKTLTDVFRRMTGIQVSQYGGRGQLATLMVRGANSDQVLVLIDGIRFTRAVKGTVDFSQLPLTFVERIEYVRGARASVYGSEAIGGVINIITRANNDTDRATRLTAGVGSRDYVEASGSSGFKVGENGQLNVALGYESDDGYNVHPIQGLNDDDKHGFETKNGLIGYVSKLNQDWTVFANARAFENVYQYDGSWNTTYSYKESTVENYSFAGGVNYESELLSSQIQVSWQDQSDYDYEKKDGKGSTQPEDLEQLNLQWNNQYELSEVVTIGGGADYRKETFIVNASNSDYDRDNLAFYGIALVDFENVFGELGARLDDNEQFGSETTYNFGAGFRLTEELVLKMSYGTAFKAPNLYQLYSSIGNAKLKPESAKSAELSLNGAVQGIYWSVTGYNTKIDDLIEYDFSTFTYHNLDGESTLKGVELTAEFDTGFLSHQLSADFKDPKDEEGNLLPYRAKKSYKYNAIAYFDEFDLSLGYQYIGKRENSGTKLGSYSLLDASVNYFATESVTLNARVDNLLDKEYEMVIGYPAPERTFYVSMDYRF
ncbi:TonB-dependent vitamin B12 receptor [Grimontia kaedaensis]|uniref:Vitamin B12 transporter BtuB n=1 Tax=Grimontia kaedaensis TaxID=2872157 RepID=A0ABY4WS99_9GAMM|nr:TonB-dependent vitamin B12 receptor [Grimontia kaedaensis]USH02339.1 TonB-dependent vitamin B12 receptor [Grimontia kaedaensis]